MPTIKQQQRDMSNVGSSRDTAPIIQNYARYFLLIKVSWRLATSGVVRQMSPREIAPQIKNEVPLH